MWILKTLEAPDGTALFTFRRHAGLNQDAGPGASRADFVVDVPLVSRFHCRFTASVEGNLLLEDLESTNGTLVNDKRVDKSVLTQGDRVRIGRVELAVERGLGVQEGGTGCSSAPGRCRAGAMPRVDGSVVGESEQHRSD